MFLLSHRFFPPTENLTRGFISVPPTPFCSWATERAPHAHRHSWSGVMFSTACDGQKWDRVLSGHLQGPVPHTWLVLPLFPRAGVRSLQCHLPGSGKEPFCPHGESGSWGQSRVGSQSTFLQGEGERADLVERCGGTAGRGGARLPSISAPVDEIWLRESLAVPISSRQLRVELERSTL